MGALAALSGHALVRLNLSEQTDMMDLLGADLPDEGGAFVWRAGLLLRAVESGAWLLLGAPSPLSPPPLSFPQTR